MDPSLEPDVVKSSAQQISVHRDQVVFAQLRPDPTAIGVGLKALCERPDQRRIGGPVDVFGRIECWIALHAAKLPEAEVARYGPGPSRKRKRGRQRLSMARRTSPPRVGHEKALHSPRSRINSEPRFRTYLLYTAHTSGCHSQIGTLFKKRWPSMKAVRCSEARAL